MTITRSMNPLSFDDIVYVRNAGDTPIYGKLSPTKRFEIPPGKTKLMSWSDASMCFGNPFEPNADERDRRHNQVMCLYGAFDARLDAHLLPQIEVTTEEGERVYMLIEDPSGQANVSTTLEDDYGDPRLAKINAMLAEASRLKTEIMMEMQTDPNGRPIAQAGSNPQGQRNVTNAPAGLDNSHMYDAEGPVSVVRARGGRPADFNTVGATAVDSDLLPQGDPAAHRAPRPAAWDLPANADYVEPNALPSPADLLIGTPQQPVAGPRREGLIIPRNA